jgi:hypothetical protein
MRTSWFPYMASLVACWKGKGHAPVERLLKNFIAEYNEILELGYVEVTLNYIVMRIPIVHKHIICDAQALCMIKAIKAPSGYSSCSKCNVKGSYERIGTSMHTFFLSNRPGMFQIAQNLKLESKSLKI